MDKKILILTFCAVAGIGAVYYTSNSGKSETNNTFDTNHTNAQTTKETKMNSTESGILFEILTPAPQGSAKPQVGQKVTVHYTGWLNEDGQPGKKFDSSVDLGQKFEFMVGIGQVIRGWDESVLDMQIGEKRRVIIPSELAYGSRGAGTIIAPGSDLIFDIELFKAS